MNKQLLLLLGLTLTVVGASGVFLLQKPAEHTSINMPVQDAPSESPSPSGSVVPEENASPAVQHSMEVNSNGETYPQLPQAAHPEGVEKVNDAD